MTAGNGVVTGWMFNPLKELSMKYAYVAFALASLVTATVATTSLAAEDYAGAREHTMKTIGKSMRQLGSMVKGDVAFNATDAKAALAKIASNSTDFPKYYPAGSESASTASLPAIWKNFADFKGQADKTATDANPAIASADSLAAFKPAFAKLAGDCKSCHDTYRAAD